MSTKLINRIDKLIPTGAHRLALVVVNAIAVLLAFVPLFNLVGYESAATFGVILGVLATGLTVHSVRSGRVEAPLAPERTGPPTSDFGMLTLAHLTLAAGPLLILTLNGLRVPNCDWTSGFAFWGLIVVPSILLGQAAAWIGVSVFPDRKIAPWLVAFSFPVGDGVALLYHLATEPPIIGHHWFLGYFGGSIYDEALAIPTSLIAYRVLHILAVVAVVSAIHAAFDLKRHRWPGWMLIVVVGSMVTLSAGLSQRMDFGISIDADYISAELGGKVETEHFVIYYPETTSHIEGLDELIDDHEYRYHQLREFFGTDPVAESGQKVRSFVYDDRDSKGRLMGGRDTMVAKLWLQEMHILWRGAGDHMLAHELAHIFTEPFGSGPLRLSMQRGIGVNMGLVEGVAAAAEWASRELTPHEASAAMRELDIAPDLRRILGAGGFWTEASGPAYTAMGSFVRFLIDEEGIDAFKEAYGRGDFETAYGVQVEVLIDRWEVFVDELVLTDREMEVARFLYDRSSIFGKDCARALAERRRQARNATARGALGEARHHYELFLAEDGTNPRALLEYARLLSNMDQCDEAMAVVDARPVERLNRVNEASFLELQGDILWRGDDQSGAGRAYAAALELGLPVDRERSLQIKRELTERGDNRGRSYLIELARDSMATYRLMRWRFESPDDRIAAYFVGRRLWQAKNYSAAIAHLEVARGGLSAEVLDAEVLLMLGQSYYFEDQLDASKRIWIELVGSPVTRYREGARDWLTRLQWADGNRD